MKPQKFENRISVKDKIIKVLMENKNGFLTHIEIAETAYGDAYMYESYKHYNGLVKRNVQHAIAKLTEDGFLVIKDLEPTQNGNKLSYKSVNGYKIADKEDVDYVIQNLKTKEERLEIAQDIKDTYRLIAKDNNLLLE